MDHLKMRTLLVTGIAVAAMGLMSIPAMADPDDFVNQSNLEFHPETPEIKDLPPDAGKKVVKNIEKRKSAFRICQVNASACGLNCIKKYSEKNQQALCFKANKCQAAWEKCVRHVQDKYPLDTSKVIELMKDTKPE